MAAQRFSQADYYQHVKDCCWRVIPTLPHRSELVSFDLGPLAGWPWPAQVVHPGSPVTSKLPRRGSLPVLSCFLPPPGQFFLHPGYHRSSRQVSCVVMWLLVFLAGCPLVIASIWTSLLPSKKKNKKQSLGSWVLFPPLQCSLMRE